MTVFIQVQITFPDSESADEISLMLVQTELVACSQVVGPIRSTYRWKGKIEVRDEYMCLVKTRLSLFHKVRDMVLHHHPYEVPEIISTSIVDSSPSYLEWLKSSIPEK
ncbi:MAG: divalent-cation tolerance protein CutA [Candidatus Thermoplasmatota archaeon]|nr:divalent-cation tolerance protein CutA [Candidatus Thermoplasmatota archaeon]